MMNKYIRPKRVATEGPPPSLARAFSSLAIHRNDGPQA
jgi:hypothetical protein